MRPAPAGYLEDIFSPWREDYILPSPWREKVRVRVRNVSSGVTHLFERAYAAVFSEFLVYRHRIDYERSANKLNLTNLEDELR